MHKWKRGKLTLVLLTLQVLFIVIFALFVDYDQDADAKHPKNNMSPGLGGKDPKDNSLKDYYPMFQDVHVMIFIGFGFLMTFLKKYGYSAVGLNMLIAAICLQWALIMQNVWHAENGKIRIQISSLLGADFSSAAVLISFGALLGKTSPLQLIVVAVIEIAIFTANEHLGVNVYQTADVGGSMFIHVFGAYFGLATALVIYWKEARDHPKEGSSYQSDIFAMIGTIFLWLFWPSFNGAPAEGDKRHRAVINTYLCLSTSCVTSFAISSLLDAKNRFNMVHIQNSTLAGGVAIGTSADMMTQPYGALIIGMVAGSISVLGYRFLTPALAKHCRIHDTCGVHNLHGLPGILAGLVGTIMAGIASEKEYGYSLYEIFPARAPPENSTELYEIHSELLRIEPGIGRTASGQALYQLAALVTTLAVAISGGILTGLVIKLPIFDPLEYDQLFEDDGYWEIPGEEVVTSIKGGGSSVVPEEPMNIYAVPKEESNTGVVNDPV